MTNTLTALRRETAKLKESLSNEKTKVVFQMIDSDGRKTEKVDLSGKKVKHGDYITMVAPEKSLLPLLSEKRHTVLYGGRSGGKSHTIARFLISLAYSRTVKVLCVREVQTSIRESVHSLLSEIIQSIPEFLEFFEILESEIRGKNGSLFSFRGMRKESAYSIKSFEGFDFCWTEEANAISRRSIDLIIPTIRKRGSRLLWSFNPENADDPVYQDFILIDRPDTIKQEILYTDNPFTSQETLADAEILKKSDLSKFNHIYLGGLQEKGRGMIFPDFTVCEKIDLSELPFRSFQDRQRHGNITGKFERENGKGSVFCGLDFGHSGMNHPTHLIIGWFSPSQGKVLILEEYRGIDKTLDQLGYEIIQKITILKQKNIPVWCDNSRPESIAHLRGKGLNTKPAQKWPNSVLEGIEKLKTLQIIICENCKETINDFSRYSWLLDANDVPLGEPEKKNDHAPDALRYGLWSWIRNDNIGYRQLADPFI